MKAQLRSVLWILAGLALGCGGDDDVALDDAAGPATMSDASLDAGIDAALANDGGRDAGGAAGDGGRLQDMRVFALDDAGLPFAALSDVKAETDRLWGVLAGAGYQIEVPKQWNGTLVVYAHGERGPVAALSVEPPAALRRHLIEWGYAWAASSFHTNYYDVRAGIEDSNALALAFTRLVGESGRKLSEPASRYIVGHALGGHVAAAAVERETLERAENEVRYDGALALCAGLGDVALFDYHAAYQAAVHTLTETPRSANASEFGLVRTRLLDLLFAPYPRTSTRLGRRLAAIVLNLSGGERPVFDLGYADKRVQDALWFTGFGGDGTIGGIVPRALTDTRDVVYQLDADPQLSAEEEAFNARVVRMVGDRSANDLPRAGLRYLPVLHGELTAPVLTLHTLGDLFVPFKMQQLYRERAEASGSGGRLVQRAIRGIGPCEFTVAEQVSAFDALVRWARDGSKPGGDDVLDPAVVSGESYGCKFTQNTFTPDELSAPIAAARMRVPACPPR